MESRDGHLNSDLPRALSGLGVILCIVHSIRLSIVPLFLSYHAIVSVWINIFLVQFADIGDPTCAVLLLHRDMAVEPDAGTVVAAAAI